MAQTFFPRPLRALLAAALLTTPLAAAAAEAPDDAAMFEQLRQQDMRVAGVAFALTSRNAAACGTAVAAQAGLVLHGLAQYDPRDRADVARHFGLADAPGVMGVVAGSPAERAGLRADDSLLSVNGRSLVFGGSAGKAAGRDTIEQATLILEQEMAKGAITVRYRRRNAEAETLVTPVMGCASQVELLAGGKLNAWANGRHIMIGEAMLAASRTDDDLAFVIAHELAHNVIRAMTGEKHSRANELAADRLALALVKGAGYDTARALATWKPYFYRAGGSRTHPAPDARIAAIEAGITETR
jgi:hypothetical protein